MTRGTAMETSQTAPACAPRLTLGCFSFVSFDEGKLWQESGRLSFLLSPSKLTLPEARAKLPRLPPQPSRTRHRHGWGSELALVKEVAQLYRNGRSAPSWPGSTRCARPTSSLNGVEEEGSGKGSFALPLQRHKTRLRAFTLRGTPGKEGPTWLNVRLHTIDAP